MKRLNKAEEVPMPTTANNIITFPKKNVRADDSGPVQSEDDVIERVAAVKQLHIDDVLSAIMDTVCVQLSVGGFDCTEDQSPYLAFIAEGMRAMMNEQYGLHHPFQPLVNQVMVEDEEVEFELIYNINEDLINKIIDDEEIEEKVEAVSEEVVGTVA
jgi:hypothetical protein